MINEEPGEQRACLMRCGERLVNIVRMMIVSACYAFYLANQAGLALLAERLSISPQLGNWLLTSTVVVIMWQVLALLISLNTEQPNYLPFCSYLAVLFDILLLTVILTTTTGPQSPFMLGYFIILISLLFRCSRYLLWYAVGMTLLAYWAVCSTSHELTDESISQTGLEQFVTLGGLLLSGLLIDQFITAIRTGQISQLQNNRTDSEQPGEGSCNLLWYHLISLLLLLAGVYTVWPFLSLVLFLLLILPLLSYWLLVNHPLLEQQKRPFPGAVLVSYAVSMTLLGFILLLGCAALVMFCYFNPAAFF